MAIPASRLVNITPRVISSGSTELELAGVLLTKNAIMPYPLLMGFTGQQAVGEYFGYDSDEYRLAVIYFLGFTNSSKKPNTLYFFRRADEAIAGALIGSQALGVTDLQKITEGGFTISVDGTPITVTGLDFSSAKTQSDIAALIQAKVTGTTVTFNTDQKNYRIVSNTTGNDSSVTYATNGTDVEALGTDVATALGLTAAVGAVVSQGTAALTPTQTMNAAVKQSENWVSFTTVYQASTEEALELAAWSNSNLNKFLYCAYSMDAGQIAGGDSSLPGQLAFNDYEGTINTYDNGEVSVFVMSCAASIDWNREQGAISWAFKTQSGLAPTCTDDQTQASLLDNKVNFYGRYASRSEQFNIFYNGAMSGGSYGFVDVYINMIWLQNVMQTACLNGMQQTQRLPYVDRGYTMIKAWLTDPINRALTNGVIDPGVRLSEAQKAQLYQEAGEDISTELYTNGFVIRVTDPAPEVRATRGTPNISVWYTYGGSVNKIEFPLTAVV